MIHNPDEYLGPLTTGPAISYDRPTVAAYRRLWALAHQIGLADDERHELTDIVLRKDDTSWRNLTAIECRNLSFALDGYLRVRELLQLRIAPPLSHVPPPGSP